MADTITPEVLLRKAAEALEPFVALADKKDAIYRQRGGRPDSFPDTHPSYDISADSRVLPMGPWRKARTALSAIREYLGRPTRDEREVFVDMLEGKSGSAYRQYIETLQRTECLGWEHKIKTGTFGEPELKAHTLAAEYLGMHRAFAAAVADARASLSTENHK